MRKGFFLMVGCVLATVTTGYAQTIPVGDSSRLFHQYLPEITVVGRNSQRDVIQLPEVVGTSIYAGKKNALVILDNVKGNVVNNTMRQVMAKVPGIHVWESDGSGIQIGISARGLSPNRSWEFNVRQNGYDIAADPFGYPEAYYNPQLQAVQRIEVVRGQGALQYGPQFGGLINYILRNGSEINKPLQVETQQTLGSNQLLNSYVALGGNAKRLHYYSFFDQRSASGWRKNSEYITRSGYATLTYKVTPKFSLTSEWMYSHINSQQPGGLTDQQLYQDARQSLRARNWMDITWVTGALIANYQYSENGKINWKLFTVMGDRNSVGFLQPIIVQDTLQASTLAFANRTVDIDRYRNTGMEGRIIQQFGRAGYKHTFSGGLRLYTGATYRYRDGKGTTESDYNAGLVDPRWPRDIDFYSNNAALFAEQIFRLSKRFIVVPGIRYEYLMARAEGINGYDLAGSPIYLQKEKRNRSFLLGGIGMEYHTSDDAEIYANITRAYRPIQFADLTAPPTTDLVDPEIKDARGYNADLGYRGKWKDFLYFDVSAFLLQYNDRIGLITQQRADGTFYNFRTNVGNSQSKGVELYAEFKPVNLFSPNGNALDLSLFASYGYTEALYKRFRVVTKSSANELVETDLRNKRVENAPRHILRGGLTAAYKKFTVTAQYSGVSGSYADANNTVAASSNGQNGWIPGYAIADLTITCKLSSALQFRSGINNVLDKRYFTRRAGGYPGPGALPADGRTGFITLIFKY